MTLMARKVDVQDESCLQVDWKELVSGIPLSFSVATENLSLGNEGNTGYSAIQLSRSTY